MRMMHRAYRWVARQRYCGQTTCRADRSLRSKLLDWIPLIVLPPIVIVAGGLMPAWVMMWLLAGAIYAGFKWMTWWRARASGGAGAGRSLAYLFLWPGMDARRFLSATQQVDQPRASQWMAAILKLTFGLVLFFFVAGKLAADPLMSAWMGMIGLSFILHFGLFDLLACGLRTLGIDARPLMRSPFLATSLSDFWANRWNAGFYQLAFDLIFRPLVRLTGPRCAMLVTFLASGLLHDLVISVPAGGGYGRPTIFFTLQGVGLLIQRSRWARRWGLDRDAVGRALTILITVGPLLWLFHPPFVVRVFLPFMSAVGAV